MNRILTTAIALMLTLAVSAQIEERRNMFEVGLAGGATFSSMDLQPTVRQKNLPGLNGGISMRYTTEKYFNMICAAQLEVNFAQRGWKEDFDDKTSNSFSRRLNYVEIPFMAHLSFGKEPYGLQFFINLGPQISFLLSDSEKYEGEWKIENRPYASQTIYGKQIDNKFDYGILGGAGIELKTKAGNFFVEGRYYYGLGDIFNNSKTDDFGRSANTTIYARIGYSTRIF
jgi:hypothetical protein